MRTLLIVFHSLSGGTRQMAEAASLGAHMEHGICARLLPAADATSADVLGADGYIFATPENLGAMAGRMKDFFRPHVLCGVGPDQRPALRNTHLRRQ